MRNQQSYIEGGGACEEVKVNMGGEDFGLVHIFYGFGVIFRGLVSVSHSPVRNVWGVSMIHVVKLGPPALSRQLYHCLIT